MALAGYARVSDSKFKATCLGVLDDVRKTRTPVRITRFGQQVADVVPASVPSREAWLGCMAGDGEVDEDIVGPIGAFPGWSPRKRASSWIHIWIWRLMRPEMLGTRVRRCLRSANAVLLLSPVSIWAARLLYEKRRIRTRESFESWLDRALRAPLREAPFNWAVAAQASRTRSVQPDPGDLFPAATAVVFARQLG